MSAKWSGYFKVVTPRPETTTITDNQDVTGSGAYGNYSWYARFLQGTASRVTRYKEYEAMDQDVEVALALDTIAEHMTETNSKTDMAIDLDMQVEEGQIVKSSIILTLRSALRHWCNMHDWDNRLYNLSRALCIYGDVFFMKLNDYTEWTFVHPSRVVGALVDEKNVRKVIAWQVKMDTAHANKSNVSGIYQSASGTSDMQTELIPVDRMVRFALTDDMSESAPFGDSILRPVFRSHRQKMMLEDAILIYRVQRAPEKRVYYVDVGKMPPQRVKTHLEQMKNEIRQKKVPSINGGKDTMDSIYNVQSMSEDFFMAVRPDGKGNKVETLPGGANLGELTDLEYFQTKVWRGLKVPINWMKQSSDSLFGDGQVGTAYMEEMRFVKFVMRLQGYVEKVLDDEFKKYLKKCNIVIDDTLYKLRLPKPTNFAGYRQQQLDAELLNAITNANGVTYLSPRFILQRFGQFNDEELLNNERLKMQELGLDPNNPPPDYLAQIYSGAGGGDLGGMGGGSLGGGGGLAGGEGMVAGGENPDAGQPGQPGVKDSQSPMGAPKPGSPENKKVPPTAK